MDRITLSGGVPSLALIPLGTFHNGKYYINGECVSYLEEICAEIVCEDPNMRPLRRALGFLDILNKDLIPIVVNSDEQSSTFYLTIKLLVLLTVPIECLVCSETFDQNPKSQQIIYELSQFLYNAKETFLNPWATQTIMEPVRRRLLENKPMMSIDDNESVHNSLLLIRNILHAPERPTDIIETEGTESTTAKNSASLGPNSHNSCYTTSRLQQNRLMWNLFAQGFDQLLIQLLSSSQKDQWVATIVQLIPLFYKDHRVEFMKKLLQTRTSNTGISKSSEIHEKNNALRPNGTIIENLLQSSLDPASDSFPRNASVQASSGEHSEPISAKIPIGKKLKERVSSKIALRKELPRLGLRLNESVTIPLFPQKDGTGTAGPFAKFSSFTHVGIKAISQYTPSEEDISELLKEFTVDFLLNGYNTLVGELHQQLSQQGSNMPLDKSHFLWLITYFLPLASQLHLDMEHFKDIFTVDLLSYLTYEAVRETEEFEMKLLESSSDLKPCLRRLHLTVTAIREYLQALEAYPRLSSTHSSRKGTSQGCEEKITHLRGCLPAMHDLYKLFILRLRLFNPTLQSRRYLLDVITANHVLLLTLERATQQSSYGACVDLRMHLNQFCSRTILSHYGTALQDFKTNGTFVNDCIFTILHHVGTDLSRVDLLYEPAILRTFSKIWEEEFKINDDWNDLIEFVVHKFMYNFQKKNLYNKEVLDKDLRMPQDQEDDSIDLRPNGVTKQQVFEHIDSRVHLTYEESLKTCMERLVSYGFQQQLDWIQSSLLVACSARLGTYTGQEFRNPMACLSLKKNEPYTIVPWTEVEASALRSELFLTFLHQLGLLPPAPTLYPRIPREWSADALYSIALLFGPVNQKKVNFDLVRVSIVDLSVLEISISLSKSD